MKKLFFALAMLALTSAASAQLYVGGALNIGYTQSNLNKSKNYDSEFNFGIAPQIGYAVSDKWDIGAYVGYNYGEDKRYRVHDTYTGINKDLYHGISVTPYTRYYFAEANKFRFFFEGRLSFDYGMVGTYVKGEDDIDEDHDNSFMLGLNVIPGISYELNEHFSLEMGLSFLRLGYSFTDTWEKGADPDEHVHSHNFNAIFNSNNILGSLGQVTVGMLYKF